MATIYYVETTRWNDGKYQPLVEQIFHGEKPQFVEENGRYTGYSLETEPTTFDQKWIVGSTRESMIQGGLIQETKVSSEDAPAQIEQHSEKIENDEPVIAGIAPFGSQFQVKALLPNSDEMQYAPMFASEGLAHEYIAQKYPNHRIVSWDDL